MVNENIVELIQNTANSFTDSTSVNYKAIYAGYSVVIYNEFTYQFKETQDKVIEAVVKFGSAQKNNDIANKFSLGFAINIFSEPNGWQIALNLFNDVFETLTRTYQTLGEYSGKIFLSSPAIMNEQVEVGDCFYAYSTMNGSVEYCKNVVLGATYSLALGTGTDITIKPRQPYCLKEAMGGIDTPLSNPSLSLFTKSSNQLTTNLVLIYELDGNTNNTSHDDLFNALLNECYGSSNQKYTFKCVCGGNTKTISNLVCVRAQHIFDEANGENVLSLQFKQAT